MRRRCHAQSEGRRWDGGSGSGASRVRGAGARSSCSETSSAKFFRARRTRPSPPHPANEGRAHRAGGAPCASCGAATRAGHETRARPPCMSTRGAEIALGCPPCPPSATCRPAADLWGSPRLRRTRPEAGVHPATRRVTTRGPTPLLTSLLFGGSRKTGLRPSGTEPGHVYTRRALSHAPSIRCFWRVI